MFLKEVEFFGRIKIGIDSNLMSFDIFYFEKGWIRVDLSELYRIVEIYDRIIDGLKSVQWKVLKRIGVFFKKYWMRRRNRIEDYLNKFVVQFLREFFDVVFVFEDLNKFKMFQNGLRKFNRKFFCVIWKKIVGKFFYCVFVEFVNFVYILFICLVCGSWLEF